jgi:hypothetical protein
MKRVLVTVAAWVLAITLGAVVNAQPANKTLLCPFGYLTSEQGQGDGEAENWLYALGVDRVHLNYVTPIGSDCDADVYRSLNVGKTWLVELDGQVKSLAGGTAHRKLDDAAGWYKVVISKCTDPEKMVINYRCGPRLTVPLPGNLPD